MTTIRTTAPQSTVVRLAWLLAPYRVTDERAARRVVRASRANYAATVVPRQRVTVAAVGVPAAHGVLAASAAH